MKYFESVLDYILYSDNSYIFILLIFFSFIFTPVFLYIKSINKSKKRNEVIKFKKFLKPVVKQFYPPKNWDILKTQLFIKSKLTANAITAEIFQLAINGYIEIERKQNSTVLVRTHKSLKDLPSALQIFVEGLFSKKDRICLDKKLGNIIFSRNSPEYNKTFNKTLLEVEKLVEEDLIEERLLCQSESLLRTRKLISVLVPFVIISSSILTLFFLLNQQFIYSIVFVVIFMFFIILSFWFHKLPRIDLKYSKEGKEYLRKIQGLYHYIEIAERERINFHNNPNIDENIFEILLPYAILFGMEEKWKDIFDTSSTQWTLFDTNDMYRPLSNMLDLD